MEQSIVKIENSELTARLFGSYDVNVRMLERAFDVAIRNRSGDEGDAVAISGEDPEGVRMASEAVKTLTPREQKIIALRYYKDKTQMEIAAEIGISQAQVSRVEKAALEKLRKQL